jgi:hypothetical protein
MLIKNNYVQMVEKFNSTLGKVTGVLAPTETVQWVFVPQSTHRVGAHGMMNIIVGNLKERGNLSDLVVERRLVLNGL